MNFLNYQLSSKILSWLRLKKCCYSDLIELDKERITYNASFLPLPTLAWELDSVQNRYIMIANKSVGLIDTFDIKQLDATLLPNELSPKKGYVCDLSWFPRDNSISAILTNVGYFNLIDMNGLVSVDNFDLEIPCSCIKFDKSGNFPFSVAVGTKIGLRFCDLKSGSLLQLLKTKTSVECIEYSPINSHELYTGLSNGNVLLWDLRKTTKQVEEIMHPNKIESSVNQICHSLFTNGMILVGHSNGDIISYCSSSLKNLWTISSSAQRNPVSTFLVTPYEHIICPSKGKFNFIDLFYGKITSSCYSAILSLPSKIIINPINNDIYVFDSNYIGAIFRFKPQKLYCENIL